MVASFKYLFKSASLFPIKKPIYARVVTQIPDPRPVKMINGIMGILRAPAGKEIYCLIPGRSLPTNVLIGPCS